MLRLPHQQELWNSWLQEFCHQKPEKEYNNTFNDFHGFLLARMIDSSSEEEAANRVVKELENKWIKIKVN